MSMIVTNGPRFLPLKFNNALEEQEHGIHNHSIFRDFNVDETIVGLLQEANNLSMRFSSNFLSTTADEGLVVLSQLSSVMQRFLQAPDVSSDLEITALSESCRYAGALHVLFPLMGHYPDPTLMVNALVHKLKEFLIHVTMSMGLGNPVLLWCLAVGGVSAYQLSERSWFVGHLAEVTAVLYIKSWGDMRACLAGVMSYAVFCEDSFRAVWEEVAAKDYN
jgi:hypothetical protein